MFEDLPLPWLLAWLGGATLVILVAGTRLSLVADLIGDRLHVGKALTGAVFLGAVTSLSGIITSVAAAWHGRPELAASNAVGGIAAQTAFLAVADITWRHANLEHDAASADNILQAALLVVVLTCALLAMTGPDVTAWGVHPGTALLIGTYLGGLRIVQRAAEHPMWAPTGPRAPGVDLAPDEGPVQRSTARLWAEFAVLGSAVAVAGWVMARGGGALADRTGIDENVVGALGTAVATSLPELVTTLAAVRRGALSLAVGGIIGGNVFDVLFLAAADVAYRPGSLYHAAGEVTPFLLTVSVLMTGILLMGLVRRERRGPANIGFESVLILAVYAGSIAVLALW